MTLPRLGAQLMVTPEIGIAIGAAGAAAIFFNIHRQASVRLNDGVMAVFMLLLLSLLMLRGVVLVVGAVDARADGTMECLVLVTMEGCVNGEGLTGRRERCGLFCQSGRQCQCARAFQ